ncbi:MAG: hypothetical protein K6B69_09480 [Lachnospiraceae bacterium]|nr:hypothetical protein [Lachnospiraceae bacterium]
MERLRKASVLLILPGFDAFFGWSACGKHQICGFFRVLMLFRVERLRKASDLWILLDFDAFFRVERLHKASDLWILLDFDAFSEWSDYGKHQICGFGWILMLFLGGVLAESIRI